MKEIPSREGGLSLGCKNGSSRGVAIWWLFITVVVII
jgi:hypothetical protein